MIEFRLKGNKYTIDQITIQHYYDIHTLLVSTSATNKLEIVSKLSGCPMDHLKQLDNVEFAILWSELVNGPLDLNDTLPFHKYFGLKDKMYGFTDIKNITIGEIADMDVLSKDPRKDQMLHKMMAVLYRPALDITDNWVIVEPYDANTVEERAKEFLQMPIAYVFGALNFFLQIKKFSIEAMLDSLTTTEEMTKEQEELISLTKQITLELLEGGTTPSASWQMTTLQSLTRLQELAQSMPSTFSLDPKTKPAKKSWNTIKSWLSTKKDKKQPVK